MLTHLRDAQSSLHLSCTPSISVQVCRCEACDRLHEDAAADSEFRTVQSAASSSGSSAAAIATTGAGRRRKLQATSNDDIMAELVKVGTVYWQGLTVRIYAQTQKRQAICKGNMAA
jgi:hypothetical protein